MAAYSQFPWQYSTTSVRAEHADLDETPRAARESSRYSNFEFRRSSMAYAHEIPTSPAASYDTRDTTDVGQPLRRDPLSASAFEPLRQATNPGLSHSEDISYNSGRFYRSPIQEPTIRRNESMISRLSRTFSGPYGRLQNTDEPRVTRSRYHHQADDDTQPMAFDNSGLTGAQPTRNGWTANTEAEASNVARGSLANTQYQSGRLRNRCNADEHGILLTDPSTWEYRQDSSFFVNPTDSGRRWEHPDGRGVIAGVHEPVFDISDFHAGGDQSLDHDDDLAGQIFAMETDDRVKPNWKPSVLRWPWLVSLVLLAVALACLYEYLAILSEQRKQENKGLLTFEEPKEISTLAYFTWRYLPTMVLVTYGVMWQVVDYEIKRLEPYYQLSTKTGALAETSLNLDYLTSLTCVIPLKAIKHRHWAVLTSSVASLMAGGLLAILQAAALDLLPKPKDRKLHEDKFVRISPVWARLVSSTLGVIAVLGIVLLFLMRRRSGLLSNPQGIAGVAAMASKSHILQDFRDLDVASNDDIHARLSSRRYMLYQSSLRQGRLLRETERKKAESAKHPHSWMLRVPVGLAYICAILLVLALIPVFTFVDSAIAFSAKFPWVLTVCATGIKLVWVCLDMNIRILEPYHVLSRWNAPPKTLTLDYTGKWPFYLTGSAMRNGHWLVAATSVGAIFAEALTVLVNSFAVDGRLFIVGKGKPNDDSNRGNTSETFRSFWISFGMSMGILVYLTITAVAVYIARHRKFLPREPGTIAGVLAYIHQSRMLDDFNNTETKTAKEMTQHLESLNGGVGKRYGLGVFVGRDRKQHCGVDEEPFRGKYKHGKNFTASSLAGEHVGLWDRY